MQTDEFIDRVARVGDITDRDTARKVTFATIEALCLHLSPEETRRMASQLPQELAEAARNGQHQAAAMNEDHVGLTRFYSEVARRAGMDNQDIEDPAHSVIVMLGGAISSGEYTDVTFDLPPDLNTLMVG